MIEALVQRQNKKRRNKMPLVGFKMKQSYHTDRRGTSTYLYMFVSV